MKKSILPHRIMGERYIGDTPHVLYYSMGNNGWKSSKTLPPVDSGMVPCYLDGGDNANSLFGDGELQMQRPGDSEGYEKEVFIEEGKEYTIELTAMSSWNCYKKGHRIRIEISSSNFPRFECNLNTGGDNFTDSKLITAHSRIHHPEDISHRSGCRWTGKESNRLPRIIVYN
ncbi:MAG: hypothetical protein AMS26_18240 [Bacteroides sp. SM23_62]|nr:MAG: hypothetical protein AMS26_18240 [Bacteroides sp. SM23_62]